MGAEPDVRLPSYIGNEVRSWSMTNMHVFGNGMVGEGRLSLSKVETLSDLAPAAKVDAKDVGFYGVEKTESHYVPQFPQIGVTGTGGSFQINPPAAPRWDRSLMNGGNYRLSWVTGRHNVKVGYEYLYRHWRTLRQHAGTSGNWGHNGQSTRRLSDGAGGLGMADFLLGRPSSFPSAGSATPISPCPSRTTVKVLTRGPKQSGGSLWPINILAGVPSAMRSIAKDLSNQYKLTYELPTGVRPSDRLDVSINRRGATLRSPTRIRARE